ncbi:MAG TPA: hypothetical protein VGG10_01215 [Rhizomicrobium sp.]
MAGTKPGHDGFFVLRKTHYYFHSPTNVVMAGLSAAKLPAIHCLSVGDEAGCADTEVMDGRDERPAMTAFSLRKKHEGV